MGLAGIRFDSLTTLPVTLEGNWLPPPRRAWHGCARAVEPLVGLAFLCCDGIVQWSRSERRREEGLEIQFALLPYDAAGLAVQVNFSVGRGYRLGRLSVRSPGYVPELCMPEDFRTGLVERVATVEGAPAFNLLALLVARRDVRSGRNGLWRVRRELAEGIPEPFRGMLTYGRTGSLSAG